MTERNVEENKEEQDGEEQHEERTRPAFITNQYVSIYNLFPEKFPRTPKQCLAARENGPRQEAHQLLPNTINKPNLCIPLPVSYIFFIVCPQIVKITAEQKRG